jgi:hypothetical protein
MLSLTLNSIQSDYRAAHQRHSSYQRILLWSVGWHVAPCWKQYCKSRPFGLQARQAQINHWAGGTLSIHWKKDDVSFSSRSTTCLVFFLALAAAVFFPPSSWPHTQHIREAEEGREWEVQPRKFRRALDMSSEPVFVAALSKLMIRFSSLFPHFSPSSPSSSFSLLLHLRFLGLLFVGKKIIIIVQFRESGCENCSFFKMDEDHERVVDCTTPNFTG